MERVVRDQIYWAQTLIVVALFAIVLLSPFRSRWATAATSILAGLCLGWTWLTREEGVWLLPGLAILVAGAFLIDWKKAGLSKAKLLNLGMALLGFAVIQASFMTINRLEYGSFVGVDVKERNFVRALDALQSVQINKIAHVPVSNDAIIAIGTTVTAFAPLALELIPGGSQSGWEQWGCQIYPTTCGQIAGGWFLWALRDAAADNGYFKTPAVASRIFGDIANEVEAACADGKLPCRASPIAFMPPLSSSQLAGISSSLLAVMSKIGFWTIPFSSVQSESQYPGWQSTARARGACSTIRRSSTGARTRDPANGLRNGLIFVFRLVMPVLEVAGLILFVIALRRWRNQAMRPLLLLAGTAWILVLTRVAVLTLIDVSSFPAANLLYGAPAVYLLAVAAALSIALPFVGGGAPPPNGKRPSRPPEPTLPDRHLVGTSVIADRKATNALWMPIAIVVIDRMRMRTASNIQGSEAGRGPVEDRPRQAGQSDGHANPPPPDAFERDRRNRPEYRLDGGISPCAAAKRLARIAKPSAWVPRRVEKHAMMNV